jgi:hypothetical protein
VPICIKTTMAGKEKAIACILKVMPHNMTKITPLKEIFTVNHTHLQCR